jgi:hypothetical protein
VSRWQRGWLIPPLLLLGTACSKPFSFKTESAETVNVEELPANFKLPAKVWELIEGGEETSGSEKKEGGKEGAKGGAKAESAEGEKPAGEKGKGASPPILYSSVQVFLTEKNPGVLKAPAWRLNFPVGGGTLDLSAYVTGAPGSFYVGFELPEEFQTGTNFKVLFISQGRKRRIDDRIFGAGCSQVLDITSKFQAMMKSEGIKANTTRQRHVTLLAGHYIFSVLKEGRIYITQATLTDSKNKNLLCEAL